MNLYSLSVLLFAFGIFLTAIFALVKDVSLVTIRFGIFSLIVCGWAFLYTAWTGYDLNPDLRLKLVRYSEMFAVFIPTLWIHFVFEFVGRKGSRGFFPALYSTAALFAVLCPTPLFFKGLKAVPVFGYYKDPGPVLYVFFVFFCICVLIAFVELFRAYRTAEEPKKTQIWYFLMGWGMAFLGGTGTFLPAFGVTQFYWLFFLMPFYSIFMGIALTQFGYLEQRKVMEAVRREKLAAIGTLSACINHELRSPLFVIEGLSSAHLEGNPDRAVKDPAVEKSMRKISEQSRRALEIMKTLSDFSKQEMDAGSIEQKPVCIRETLQKVKPLIQHELAVRNVSLSEKIPEDVSEMIVNRGHLEEILFNLILNACQAVRARLSVSADSSRGEVRLEAWRYNGSIMFNVEDNGPGIPQNQLSRIFEPFYTTKESGTGLGLYITKQLVEKNKGKISVKSEEGKGTTFTLRFPRA